MNATSKSFRFEKATVQQLMIIVRYEDCAPEGTERGFTNADYEGSGRRLGQAERDHLMEWLLLIGSYGRDFLNRQTDEELERLYNLQIKGMNKE
ncbi:BH0509 family protein [Bacillus velezensis]|uniref:BH0509 family protein n=1 Tax=Bacillus velezensis TaxID=492670 RepID=UPI0038D389BF